MTIGIMQPYLFPYIGYWQLINAVDTFVIYDNIQFSKKGWFHRNNILLNGKKTLFSIPLKKDSDSLDVIERFISDGADKYIGKRLTYFLSVKVYILPLQCIDDSNQFFCNVSNSYPVFFAFCPFLCVIGCKG